MIRKNMVSKLCEYIKTLETIRAENGLYGKSSMWYETKDNFYRVSKIGNEVTITRHSKSIWCDCEEETIKVNL